MITNKILSVSLLLTALFFTLTLTLNLKKAEACGALAIDGNQGSKYGWAVDYDTISAAEKRALSEAGENSRTVMVFCGGAAAYAADQNEGSTAYGWGRAETAAVAKSIAMDYCQEKGGAGASCIIRVWGQESKKPSAQVATPIARGADLASPLTCTLNGEPGYQVFVSLSFRLGDPPVAANGMRGEKDAFFTGHTCMSLTEMASYGVLDRALAYSDKVLGTKANAVFLVTSNSSSIDRGNLAISPVMQRFVAQVVEPSNQYARRKIQPEYYRGVESKYSEGFVYVGEIIILDSTLSYDVVRRAVGDTPLSDRFRPFNDIVDAGAF